MKWTTALLSLLLLGATSNAPSSASTTKKKECEWQICYPLLAYFQGEYICVISCDPAGPWLCCSGEWCCLVLTDE
jgi:hypothetical protein